MKRLLLLLLPLLTFALLSKAEENHEDEYEALIYTFYLGSPLEFCNKDIQTHVNEILKKYDAAHCKTIDNQPYYFVANNSSQEEMLAGLNLAKELHALAQQNTIAFWMSTNYPSPISYLLDDWIVYYDVTLALAIPTQHSSAQYWQQIKDQTEKLRRYCDYRTNKTFIYEFREMENIIRLFYENNQDENIEEEQEVEENDSISIDFYVGSSAKLKNNTITRHINKILKNYDEQYLHDPTHKNIEKTCYLVTDGGPIEDMFQGLNLARDLLKLAQKHSVDYWLTINRSWFEFYSDPNLIIYYCVSLNISPNNEADINAEYWKELMQTAQHLKETSAFKTKKDSFKYEFDQIKKMFEKMYKNNPNDDEEDV